MPAENESPESSNGVEEHFIQLVAGVRDYAIFMLSPAGIIKSWNAGAERIKGYAAHEIVGKHFSQFYTPDAIATRWPEQELELAIRDGRFEDEGWRVRKDGTQFWANVVITRVVEPDGRLRGFLKITRDLTERKQAEEALRRSEQRFRLLVENVKDYAMFLLDSSGHVTSWNNGAQRIKGYSAGEIIGQHFSCFYTSEDVRDGKPQRALETALSQGSMESEGWRVRKDRTLFWASVVLTALYDEQGTLLGFAKVIRDLTEKRKSEALEVADRQKNEFLAMLAHELRNPLAPISNGLQVLKLRSADLAAVKQITDLMERQVVHLVRLVDDLLDVSRVITGKLAFKKQAIELAGVVRHAVEETQSTIDARGHELMLSLPARPVLVDADRLRLSQVISNLLNNAAKYTATPSQIWLSVQREGDEAIVRVRDPGIGIAPHVLPKVFNLFVQADNSLDRSQGGLGIGLTVVKRIVEMHGGSVSASSAGINQGSEFVVRLPVSKASAPVAKPTESGQKRPPPRRRILVVDDNVDAAVTISALLKAWGHDVQTAFGGEAALETVRHFQPEIIFLDIGMPGMSGYDVAKWLRAEPSARGIVIAAVTGYGQEADRQRSFDAGFDYHLTKPPDPSLLESLLASPRQRVPGGSNDSENN
jgi:PAS domain S-box-containing protein